MAYQGHFTLRRLHSLTGIIPIGAFLIEHLLTNSLAFFGAERFNEQVHWLQNMHYLIWLEILFIFIPLAFHGIYGLVIAWQAKNNVISYPYADNWRFFLQRWTGIITVLFVLVHLGHFRFAPWFGGEHYVGTENPFALTQQGFVDIAPGGLWYPIYIIGLATAVYHFCNGLVTFCITWGVIISIPARKRVTVLAAGLAGLLLLWGLMGLHGLKHQESTPAPIPADNSHLVQHENGLPPLDS